MSGRWTDSTRRDRLPSWWPVTVRRIKARDPVCRCDGCRRCATWGTERLGGNCIRGSAEVDHIVPGDDHKDSNLRGICRPCHALKSSEEGNAARRARRSSPGEIRHPGRLY